MRRLLALAFLLVFAAGCDSTSLQSSDVRRAFIYEFVLQEIPLRQPDGRDWDSGLSTPEPDVYLVLETESGQEIAVTEPFPNVDGRILPVTFGIPDSEVRLNEDLYIVLYDDDGLLSDEYMDQIGPFRVGDFLTPALNESFRVFSDESDVRVRLEWDD